MKLLWDDFMFDVRWHWRRIVEDFALFTVQRMPVYVRYWVVMKEWANYCTRHPKISAPYVQMDDVARELGDMVHAKTKQSSTSNSR